MSAYYESLPADRELASLKEGRAKVLAYEDRLQLFFRKEHGWQKVAEAIFAGGFRRESNDSSQIAKEWGERMLSSWVADGDTEWMFG